MNLYVVGIVAGSCLTASPVLSRTWVVHADGLGDVPTIQAGIDSASSGDTVELLNGVFAGDGNRDVDFRGKAITVASQSGDPAACVIDCEGSETELHRGFVFQSGEGYDSILRGVTIRSGFHSYGGAVESSGSSPWIETCDIIENTATREGGGLHGGGRIIRCRFINNRSLIGNIGNGGGAINGPLGVEILDCYFEGNASPWGGAVFLEEGLIRRCIFVNNSATSTRGSFGGAAIVFGWVDIEECVFVRNSADFGGAVTSLESIDKGLTIERCTFYENVAGEGSSVFSGRSRVWIHNSILARGQGGGAVSCDLGGIWASCSDFFGNLGGFGDCGTLDEDQTGNISQDPLFCDPEGGVYSIHAESPCSEANSACGLIGALPPECGATPVVPTSWGRLKARYTN